MSIGLSKRWFAWAMLHMAQRYDALLAETKRDLLGSLEGTIVEIGPGTGTNFRYYPRGVRWIGVEPNSYMHPHLRRAGNAAGIEVHVRQNHAEDMGLADGSADVVVATAVLCSVHDQARTLQEIKRVLVCMRCATQRVEAYAPSVSWGLEKIRSGYVYPSTYQLKGVPRGNKPAWLVQAEQYRRTLEKVAVLQRDHQDQ